MVGVHGQPSSGRVAVTYDADAGGGAVANRQDGQSFSWATPLEREGSLTAHRNFRTLWREAVVPSAGDSQEGNAQEEKTRWSKGHSSASAGAANQSYVEHVREPA